MTDTYSHGHHSSVLASHGDRTVHNSAVYVLPYLRPGMSVLDVGCGPGSITVGLASLVGPTGRVVGVEPVEEPLVAARERVAGRSLPVTFAQGDVYSLDFADAAFDVVHAHQVLQHLSDPVAALREMRRVCRPGGIVAARDADYAAMSWYPASPVLDRWLASYRANAIANSADPDAGRKLRAWARAAGLTEVTTTGSVWCYASPEATSWWGQSWADRVVESSFADQTVARRLETPDSLRSLRQGWLDWSRDADAYFSVPHGEIIARV